MGGPPSVVSQVGSQEGVRLIMYLKVNPTTKFLRGGSHSRANRRAQVVLPQEGPPRVSRKGVPTRVVPQWVPQVG